MTINQSIFPVSILEGSIFSDKNAKCFHYNCQHYLTSFPAILLKEARARTLRPRRTILYFQAAELYTD